MKRDFKEYTIWNNVTPVAVTSSTDATPIVVTATSHGFATGDLVMIFGHTTNVAANGIFKIVKVDANSFRLTDRYTGANVAGSGAGAGASGVLVAAPKIISCNDFTNIELSFQTSGTATTTVKAVGSMGMTKENASAQHGDTPNFGATVARTNPWMYVEMIDTIDNSTVAGGTGIVVAGTDFNKIYEVNVNALKYFTLIPISWTQGALTVKAVVYSNN